MEKAEYFGNADQQAILKRGRALSEILRDDARYSYYGRTVGLVCAQDGDPQVLASLAIAQGNSSCLAVTEGACQEYSSELSGRGLSTLVYRKWEGAKTALAAARNVVQTVPLPGDLSLKRVTMETPRDLLQSAANMALNCGVLPTCGDTLRGVLQPAVCFLVVDRSTNVVSIAAASAFAHPDHGSFAGQAWWGMLATDPARRGQKLALLLGAHVLLELEDRFGIRDFMTGVEAGNVPSETVCTKMGLEPRGMAIVACSDPAALSGGRLTK